MNIIHKLAVCVIAFYSTATLLAQESPLPTQVTKIPNQAIESSLVRGATVIRAGHAVYVTPESQDDSGTIQIPRFAASLTALDWQNASNAAQRSQPSMTPEQEYWTIQWKGRPENASVIELLFDSPPLLIDEIKPISPAGDGSFYLPAHMATTAGEKVRFEPQTFKNTVGYWTGKQDTAKWRFDARVPGKFNVAILQGCGKGQGGSVAKMEFVDSSKSTKGSALPEAVLEFEVLETGHFQNFQWRHLGTIELTNSGVYDLSIIPIAIKKAALMDVRAINLVRLPN